MMNESADQLSLHIWLIYREREESKRMKEKEKEEREQLAAAEKVGWNGLRKGWSDFCLCMCVCVCVVKSKGKVFGIF